MSDNGYLVHIDTVALIAGERVTRLRAALETQKNPQYMADILCCRVAEIREWERDGDAVVGEPYSVRTVFLEETVRLLLAAGLTARDIQIWLATDHLNNGKTPICLLQGPDRDLQLFSRLVHRELQILKRR